MITANEIKRYGTYNKLCCLVLLVPLPTSFAIACRTSRTRVAVMAMMTAVCMHNPSLGY